MSRLRIFPGVFAAQNVYVYTKVCMSVHKYIHRYASRSPGMIYECTHVVAKDAGGPVLSSQSLPFPVRSHHGFLPLENSGPYRGMQCGK